VSERVRRDGWCWPGDARKAHFFVAGRSLCGRWAFFGDALLTQGMKDVPGPDDCLTCFKKAKAASVSKEERS